jgi:H+/gluconate symporter-like permease
MGVIGIFLGLFGLMFMAYKGYNVLFLAPLMALVACLFHPEVPLLASYTQVFMPALGQYLLQYFPIFALGAIFGRMMNDSGAAYAIAKMVSSRLGPNHAVLAVVLSCALLTYGGVSLFVVAFTIYPIALQLFKDANLSRRFIPGAIALGSFTFTMTALPGTPAIQNAIPMPVFGTNAFAAPVLGLVASAIMLFGGLFWLNRRSRAAAGEVEDNFDFKKMAVPAQYPSLGLALLPLLTVLVLNYIFANFIFKGMNADYLALPLYGATTIDRVIGIWSLITALTLSLFMSLILFKKYLTKFQETINEGTYGSMLPILNTASEVGFGATIASLASFKSIQSAVLGIMPEYPLVSLSVAVNALAGITGSASGGLSIALKALGEQYVQMANAAGVPLEYMHRVASVACGGLDALPHNGAVITLLTICGLTHKKSYFDIFMVSVVIPVLANVVIVILASF